MNLTDPGATPTGRSAAEMRADLQAILDAGPTTGRWSGSVGEVSVAARLGEPASICKGYTHLTYRAELQVTTGDGRIRIARDARGYVSFDSARTLSSAWVEIAQNTVVTAEALASFGVSGVDLGPLRGARWYTEIDLVEEGGRGVRGSVVVEGVDIDGSATGTPNAVTGPVATFTWP
jgi:hypothetical protein